MKSKRVLSSLSLLILVLAGALFFPLSGCGRRDSRSGQSSVQPSVPPSTQPDAPSSDPRWTLGANVKNVIVFVGDGMGFNHLTAGEIHLGHSLSINRMPNKSAIQTYSLDNPVTDSAAGATALATGNKTNNGQIGRIGAED
ncbi:MAG: alkaline phosphatase, partial [Acidobacteriota bacterium]|nr:alkaline phosphatase [Acidobacteriota bacterium]